jgi:hypothetical protein
VDGLMTRSRVAALDDALGADLSGSAPPDTVTAELALVHRLHDAGGALAPVPTPEFREALRTRLLAVAAVQGVGEKAASRAPAAVSWRTRAVTVTAGIMATVVAAGGVAVASSRSLPGDPFYGVKRTTEALQLKVAGDQQAEGTRHLQFASTRMREVRAMVLGRDAPADAVPTRTVPAGIENAVRGALDDMDVDTRTGLSLLTSSFHATRATAPLEELSRFATAQGEGLRSVLPALTGSARLQAQKSLSLVEGVQAQADELLMLVDCTAVCDPAQVARNDDVSRDRPVRVSTSMSSSAPRTSSSTPAGTVRVGTASAGASRPSAIARTSRSRVDANCRWRVPSACWSPATLSCSASVVRLTP